MSAERLPGLPRPLDRGALARLGDRSDPTATAMAVVLLLAAVELVIVAVHPSTGVLLHAFLAVALLEAASRATWRRQADLLTALAVVPVVRIVTLAMVGPDLPPVAWAGLPLLLMLGSTLLAARVIGSSSGGSWSATLGLARPREAAVTAGVIAAGVPAGLILGMAQAPILGRVGIGLTELLLIAALAALAEELLFRGLLQRVLADAVGSTAAIGLATVPFAAIYLGTGSVAGVMGVAGLGLLLGWAANRTGSTWPAVAGHLSAGISMALVASLVNA
jgi:membrane protease YdiL (CAAX protease family)